MRTIVGRCRRGSDVSPSFATEAARGEQAAGVQHNLFYSTFSLFFSVFLTGGMLRILFSASIQFKIYPLFLCPSPPFWLQIITWSDLINNAITLSPIPLTKRVGWKSMDFPNFNYTPEVFRIDRKLKTICRLCAVGCRPGATRNAALVPRKTESGTVVSLRVPGAAQSQGPTIFGAQNPWGKILGPHWGEAEWSSFETVLATGRKSGEL